MDSLVPHHPEDTGQAGGEREEGQREGQGVAILQPKSVLLCLLEMGQNFV